MDLVVFLFKGYENPYSIQTCLQQKHNQSNETEASQHDVCHFELTVKKKSAAQKNGELTRGNRGCSNFIR